jgi:hypothetical protein
MKFILRNRPSPAMLVAFVSLCVALAGTATALPGRSKVRSDDIARNAVRSSDIAPKAVRSKHLKGRSVTRSKIARRAITSELVGRDALTGANILEASLETVPKAATVDALNGLSVKKFAFRTASVTGPTLTKLVDLNGLTLSTACERNPNIALTVSASTSITGSIIHSGGNFGPGAAFYNEDDAFNIGDTFDVLDDTATGSNSLEGALTYIRPDGGVVTATFLAEEAGTNECVFAGTMTG